MTPLRRRAGGVAALVALGAMGAGVPALLALAAGNPWPGWERVQLGDERAITVGALATLAWIVWARFVLAIVTEVPAQLAALRVERTRPPDAPVEVAAPPRPTRGGVGLLAARLVAAALVVMPVAGRSTAVAAAPVPLLAVVTPVQAIPEVPDPLDDGRSAPDSSPARRSVEVTEGDTLVGLARRHLGEAQRWREIFDLNRDRPQVGGARLSSPSGLQPGWILFLPAEVEQPAEPSPAPGPGSVTVVEGDTLWRLAHDRLELAGDRHDDARVAGYVAEIVGANLDVIEDPDLIYPGERIELPALGPEPARPVDTDPPPASAPVPADPSEPAGSSDELDAQPPLPSTTAAAASVSVPSTPPASTAPATDVDRTSLNRSSTSTTEPVGVPGEPAEGDAIGVDGSAPSPAPIGIGEAALLSTGVVALLAARRRARLRASEPRARVPDPAPERVTVERTLRGTDAHERLMRLDVAVRAAAASLLDAPAQPAVMRVGPDGGVELTLTGEARLPSPWRIERGRWMLPGRVPVELLTGAARSVGAPCLALTQLGVDADGHEVFADLEALGVLSIQGQDDATEPVLRGIAATLATSMFADVLNLVGVDVDELAFLDHRLAHRAASVEEAVELATTLIGTTASARQSTFVLRARHTSGEAWEPAVVLTGPGVAHEVTPELVRSVSRRHGGIAMVVAGDVPDGSWTLRPIDDSWRLDPLGLTLVPVGLSAPELAAVYDVLHEAGNPLAEDPAEARPPEVAPVPGIDADPDPRGGPGEPPERFVDPPWELMVRLLGPVDVVDRRGAQVSFERSKTLELIAWLTLHRERSTRAGARTALWDLDVRDATFANVVSEARRATARHVAPPEGEEWLERTLTERLPLHHLVASDADIIRARLDHARVQPPQQAIETLRPAVELIRDVPFAGTGYVWPDPEGITSNLVLLATSAATELAAHLLSMGDVEGVFWATGQGLRVLPGHEELIALRMRAHHRRGDLSGVRLEWETYERVLDADPWSDGEPATKLVALRRELLSSAS